MEKIITRTMTVFCLGLLVFYAYGVATVQPAPIWQPPQVQICFPIGGGDYCIDIPDEWL